MSFLSPHFMRKPFASICPHSLLWLPQCNTDIKVQVNECMNEWEVCKMGFWSWEQKWLGESYLGQIKLWKFSVTKHMVFFLQEKKKIFVRISKKVTLIFKHLIILDSTGTFTKDYITLTFHSKLGRIRGRIEIGAWMRVWVCHIYSAFSTLKQSG